jgi:hypothetical protein
VSARSFLIVEATAGVVLLLIGAAGLWFSFHGPSSEIVLTPRQPDGFSAYMERWQVNCLYSISAGIGIVLLYGVVRHNRKD